MAATKKAATKKYVYRVDTVKKKVYVDELGTKTSADEIRLQFYAMGGYKLEVKSQKRAENGKKIAAKNFKKKTTAAE